jgi:cyclase
MPAKADRRHFLQLLTAATAGVPLADRLFAQAAPPLDAPSTPLPLTPLGPTLRLVSGAGANVVVLNGASSVLLVNGGAHAHAARLLTAIADGTSGKRVEFLFNTDWHPENTGANLAVAEHGGQILAHEFTKQYLGIERYVEWQNAKHQPLPVKALPSQTIVKPGTMMFGGQTVQYGPLGQAHTDGDIYVFFPDANVLVVGDIMTVGNYPIADYTSGGWLGGLLNATKTLLDVARADTRIIPGEGPVQTRDDLQAQYDMLASSRDAFVKMMRQGMSAEEMLAAGSTKAFDARWGNPQLFVKTSYRGLWLHVRELGGIV